MEKEQAKECNDVVLTPPPNFAMVKDGIYRSGFPQPANFPFLQTLNLHGIIYMCPEPYPEENMKFLEANNIKLFQFGIEGKTESSVSSIPKDTINEALKILVDSKNYPLLIHCNGGKHRTGTLVACLRKLQGWCLSSVIDEYKHYAGAKSRETDMKFIESFEVCKLWKCQYSFLLRLQGFGSKKRRLVYSEENLQKPTKIPLL